MNKFIILILFIATAISCHKTEKDNILPDCSILKPNDSSWIQLGENYEIKVSATDEDGAIEKVDLYIDDDFLTSLSDEPFIFQWFVKDIVCGEHFLKAVATDNNQEEDLYITKFTIDAKSNNETGSFIDNRDNTEYLWVKVGEQKWMSENLKYIPLVLPKKIPDDYDYNKDFIWVYNYDGTNVEEAILNENYKKYGCLYDFKTSNKICPDGWHLPSDDEWKELESYLGMGNSELDQIFDRGENENIGGMLKRSRLEYWSYPNKGATGESGFNALPGGKYEQGVFFSGLNEIAYFYTSSKATTSYYPIIRTLYHEGNQINRLESSGNLGMSVRCIED